MTSTTMAIGYRNRMIEILKEMLERREDLKDLRLEMKSKGLTDIEIAGIRLAAVRSLWDQKRRNAKGRLANMPCS